MLDEVEYAELAVVLDACLGSIKREREARAVGLEQIEVRSHYAPALRLYQELTGVAASDPEELRHHQNALLGHDCRACGRALRTLDARSCVECGEPFDPRAEVSKRAHRDGLRRELMRTLTNLAAPGPRALAAMPEGTVRPDELALDLDAVCSPAIGEFGDQWSDTQLAALRRVDELLDVMSGERNPSLWTEEAVLIHPRWAEVREAAARARVALEDFRG